MPLQDYASPLKGGAYTLRTASGQVLRPATPPQMGQGQGQGSLQQSSRDAHQLPGPFGDLFQPHDIAAGAPTTGPSWPRWNLTRSFLNGDFLLHVCFLGFHTLQISLHMHPTGNSSKLVA